MQARGLLMIEHRLIERMIAIMKRTIQHIEATRKFDPLLIDTAVDFIRMYADRTHHGKEEDILFMELGKKDLSEHDLKIMNELIEEHVFGRKITKELVDANTKYRNGDSSALAPVVKSLQTLTDFYPKHIMKEDKIFFPTSRRYFSDDEDESMLEKLLEFDRNMIHEKYKSVVEALER